MRSARFRLESTPLFSQELEQTLDYIVFYCVVGNVMELRRFSYRGRNWKIQV